MKKAMKLFTLALVMLVIASSLFANGSKEDANAVPTLKWVQIGNGMPKNYDRWIAHVNEYLEEKIGVHLEMEVISWGNWDSRRNVIINTNEPWDIIFTDQKTFTSDLTVGAYADITQYLENTPALTDLIPADYFKATTVDGKIYGVPTYKDSSLTNYWIWPQEIVEKYNIPYADLHTLDEIEPYAELVHEGEGTPVRILAADAPEYVGYDDLGIGITPLGVKITDQTRTVVPIFEQDDVMEYYRDMHRWYEKGLINSDSGTLPETPRYMALKIAQGWPYAAVTTWGPQMGTTVVTSRASDTILTNATVLGSVNAISASSKYPQKALQLLELANTDSRFRDMLYYGLEGEDFTYTEDGRVHKITGDWALAGYSQASFFTVTLQDVDTYNQWDEVRALNESAIASSCLGFAMDITPVENEVINCRNIWMKYKQQLNGGSADPDVTVPRMMAELRAAGFDKVLAEAQKQINEQF